MTTGQPPSDLTLLAYQVSELRVALEKHASETKTALKEINAKLDATEEAVSDHDDRLGTLERFGKWGATVFTGIVGLFLKQRLGL